MSETAENTAGEGVRERFSHRVLNAFGSRALRMLDRIGGVLYLIFDAAGVIYASLLRRRARLGRAAIVSQIVRVGVRAIFITSLVSGAVGLILALQLAPPLEGFGSKPLVANIISVAVLRELGPLIGAIVLTGFAGAAITAEIGTMVVGEEIEALEAHALSPVRFLVVPRIVATVLSMTALGIISSMVAITAALAVSVTTLDIPYATFMQNMLTQAKLVDFLTGTSKGTLFGLLIGAIACYNGLTVTGGAAGVGRATTNTVVQCVVAIVLADLLFTAVFYALKLF